jgi:hypothetical protein
MNTGEFKIKIEKNYFGFWFLKKAFELEQQLYKK